MDPITIGLIATTVIGAGGAIFGGMQNKKASEAAGGATMENAQIEALNMRRAAKAEKIARISQTEAAYANLRRDVADAEAGYAASGVTLQGSPSTMLVAMQATGARTIEQYRRSSTYQERLYRKASRNMKAAGANASVAAGAQGSGALTGGLFQAAGGIAGGLGGIVGGLGGGGGGPAGLLGGRQGSASIM